MNTPDVSREFDTTDEENAYEMGFSDGQLQQRWWDSLTPAQQEDYEDAIERRKNERIYGINSDGR